MSRGTSYYKTGQLYPVREKENIPQNYNLHQRRKFNSSTRPHHNPIVTKPIIESLKVRYKMLHHANPGDPEVWGPAFWFSLHNGATRYPLNASPLWRERMKSFIKGIPVMVPCEKCADHATAYIESRSDLHEVVKNRDLLFNFFVDFHNFVNQRLGKPIIPLEAAIKMYKGTANVLTVEYGPTDTSSTN